MRVREIHKVACSGFTMLELMISLGLFGIVLGLGATIGGSAQVAYKQTSAAAQLEAQVKSTLDRIVSELEHGALGTMLPQLDPGAADTNGVAIQLVEDIVAGAPVMSGFTFLGFQADPLDAPDGVDNDGDGLTDEGTILMVRDIGGANADVVRLCKNVSRFLEGETTGAGDENGNGVTNESGLLIQRDGDLLTISLTLESARENGRVDMRTNSVSVMLRN